MYSRRSILAGFLATAALPACAGAPETSLRPQARPLTGAQKVKAAHPQASLARIVKEAGLSGQHSIVVANAGSGKILESVGADTALPPASVTKAITALYALHNLGGGFRYTTQVVATGNISGDTLRGDLILVGGGDPHLDTDGLNNLAKALRAKGIRKITGKFRIYSGALPYQDSIDKSQPDHVGYNPAVSGLNLNFNRVYFEWRRTGNGYATTMDARTDRIRPKVSGIKMAVVNRQAPLFTYKRGSKVEQWTVQRGALGKAGGRWLPVRDLDAYAGEVFRAVAASQGIKLPPGAATGTRPKGKVLAQQVSGTMAAQVRAMLKFSTNLTAEVTGLTTTRQRGAAARSLAASAREMTAWSKKAFGVRGIKFVDHSGLGDASRISAADMVQVLSRSGWKGPLPAVLKDHKLVNSKGAAAPIPGVRVKAKTGSLNFVSALSGFIETPNGKILAFAIFSADTRRRAGLSKAQRERPEGGRAWRKKAKRMQQRLLRRWALEYGVSS
ncbi:MAG: D-alanyl-D-alanine carboxypeptidase/D-alanyl-D-alanine-endopeptidase [Pseudomonadota bacterium]